MPKPRKFPCPYCKGRGGWKEVVLDYDQGPWYDCGFCLGEGMIVIGGPLHQIMQAYNNGLKKKLHPKKKKKQHAT